MSKVKMPAVEESTRSTRSRHKGTSVPKLPPLLINAMTLVQLREFVPALMKVVTGDCSSQNSGLVHRPHWWPPDVPLWSQDSSKKEVAFTEAMKKVVRNCYSHLGQESLLSAGELNDWKLLLGYTPSHKQINGGGDTGSPQYSPELAKSGKKPFVEIYVCFFCAKEFSGKDEMRKHQTGCKERPEDLQSHDTPAKAIKSNTRAKVKPSLSIPSPVSSAGSPTMDQFLHSFNLVPLSKAKKLRASARRNTEVDCSKLDFSDPETPKSPTTPKTPKLLISQLSRDDSGHCKRRLSYRVKEETSDTESVASGSSEDTDDQQPPTRNRSLLSIDVSSILGQRLQKHLKTDTNVCVVTDAEAFCKTPVKNQFLEKLRKKENTFPITYKPRKKAKKRPHVHMYSFTKRQRENNYLKIRTGLNRKSRMLAKSLPQCTVVVGRLSKCSLQYWVSRREREHKTVQCIFPEGPTFLSEDIDRMLGLRKKNKFLKPERCLSLANMVSEDANAELLQQKVALYRSLLSDLSTSKFSISPSKTPQTFLIPNMNTLIKPSNNSSIGPPIPGEPLTPSSSSSSPDTSKQLSKQPFCQPLKIEIPNQDSSPKSGMRRSLSTHSSHGDSLKDFMSSPDDSVSIITVSSDDDTFCNALCCTGCRERQKCKCGHNKSEPKSGGRANKMYFIKTKNRRPNGQFAARGEQPVSKESQTVKKSKITSASATNKKKFVVSLSSKGKSSKAVQKPKKKVSITTEVNKKVKDHSLVCKTKTKSKNASISDNKKRKLLVKIKAKKNQKAKENKSKLVDKQNNAVSDKKKNGKLLASDGQHGINKKTSGKTNVQSQGLSKNSSIQVRPTKLGLKSSNSMPTNPPNRGIKRQASYSPTKSAMPNPKRSRSEVLPRKRSNSVVI